MVGADRDTKFSVSHQYKLHLAARIRPRHLDDLLVREEVGRNAVEDRRRLRRLHPDLFQLLDVLAQRGLVAPGPPGDDELNGPECHTTPSACPRRRESRPTAPRESCGCGR